MTETTTTATTPKSKLSRKTLRKAARQKRAKKIVGDKEFAKAFFDAKSKRSTEKKSKFRKRRSKK